jgi:hypothetical protein
VNRSLKANLFPISDQHIIDFHTQALCNNHPVTVVDIFSYKLDGNLSEVYFISFYFNQKRHHRYLQWFLQRLGVECELLIKLDHPSLLRFYGVALVPSKLKEEQNDLIQVVCDASLAIHVDIQSSSVCFNNLGR